MNNREPSFNAADFEKQALHALEVLRRGPHRGAAKKAAGKKAAAKKKPKSNTPTVPTTPTTPTVPTIPDRITQTRYSSLQTMGRLLAQSSDVLAVLCPGLRAVENDVTKIIHYLVKVLVPASLAGVVAVPVEPYVIAMLALWIYKFGTNVLCPGKARGSSAAKRAA